MPHTMYSIEHHDILKESRAERLQEEMELRATCSSGVHKANEHWLLERGDAWITIAWRLDRVP